MLQAQLPLAIVRCETGSAEIDGEVTLLEPPIAKLKEPIVIPLADLFPAEAGES